MPRRFRFSTTRLIHTPKSRTQVSGVVDAGGGGISIPDPPTVSAVSPSSGTNAGGTSITITGTNFIAGSTVTVGGTSATSISIVSSTSITCVTPSGTAGLRNIVVSSSSGSGTLTNAFTYIGAPTVSSVTPSSGGNTGGTTITIAGTNFIAASLAVTVGGAAATSVTLISDTSLTCITPTGSTGAQNVVVTTASGSATLVNGFTYTVVTAVFSSDWRTATGQTDNALNDGGKWPGLIGAIVNTVLQVVNASSAGLSDAPTTNVLQVNHVAVPTSPSSGQTAINTLWNSPAIGESRYFRLYMRNDIANAQGSGAEGHHPIAGAYGQDPGTGWQWNFTFTNDGTFPWLFWTNNGTGGTATQWKLNGATYSHLPKFVFHRFEWKLTKVATNSYSMDVRIYNAAGTLLYDGGTLGTIKNVSGTAITAAPLAQADGEAGKWQVGTNGGSDMVFSSIQHTYYAAACVRSDDWCGPYSGGI